jgi:class 3 adenylate cyclase
LTPFVEWLEQIGLAHCARTLVDNGIDFDVAQGLTESDLRGLGLNLGDSRRLLQAVTKLAGQTIAASAGAVAVIDIAPKSTHTHPDERRQLTVMFCDIVGYTDLADRTDPEELKKIIRDYRKACATVVAHYEGYIAQYLGDGLMVYFGWPAAHEDDAERCVRAALEIVQAVKKTKLAGGLSVRIGVATGSVVIGEGSAEGTGGEDGLAVGGTPNVAARLQGLAGADEIVIGPTTRRLVRNNFELTDLGMHALKGIVTPVRAWRVQGVLKTEDRFEAAHSGAALTALVGRDEEVALLMRHWNWARSGEGQVVLLCGEPGIGKSRLTQVLRERLKHEPHASMRYQCSPFRLNSALYPTIEHLEFAAGFARDDTPEQKLDKLEAMLVGNPAQRAETAPLFAALLSLPTDRYPPLGLSPRRQKEKTFEALLGQIEALSRLQPLLMVFEDTHWIDPTSQELLDVMIPRLRTQRVLLVITYRPEYVPHAREYPYVSTMTLTGLPEHLGGELVDKVTEGKAVPPEVVQRIVARADGIPLFIEELTKSLLESRFLRDENNRYTLVEPLPALDIPDTLNALLIGRLGRRAKARELAQIGACIGREFSYELLAAVSPYKGAEFEDELQRLTATGLVFRRGTAPDATYTFKHALVQDAAYESLLKSKRQQVHAQIADTLHTKIAQGIEERFPNIKNAEPEVLAHHYTQAARFEQAAAYWLRAGQNALSRMALTEAIAHLEAGLRVIGSLLASEARDRLELECRVLLSTAWEAYGGWPAPQLADVLKPALPLARAARQPKLLARTLWGLWVQMMSVGPVKESLVWAEELLGAGEDMADEELLLVGHMAVMVCNFWLGNPHVVERHARAIIERYDRERHGHIVKSMNHDPKTLAGIYLAQVLWILGYPDQAAAIVDERDAHARLIGHPFDTGFVLTLGAWVFHYRGEPEKQYARNEEVKKLARDAGLPFLSQVLAPYLSTGISLAQQGQLAEGIEHMRTGIRLWEEAGAKTVTPYIRSRLGEALARNGDVDGGLSHVDAMLEQIARPGWEERSHLAEVLRLKGWMLSLKGDLAGAERNYLASLDWAREQRAKSWELRTSISLAGLWQAQGRRREAYDLLKPIYGWFTEGFDTKDLIEAKALLAEVA